MVCIMFYNVEFYKVYICYIFQINHLILLYNFMIQLVFRLNQKIITIMKGWLKFTKRMKITFCEDQNKNLKNWSLYFG